jgi:NAD(P)-dependent dehydrogenase (short-subunit alcohol dehydrogenase family)
MDILSSFSLDGRVAIVTGAKRGLGKAIALAFADAGADVAVCTRDVADGKLEATADEVRKLGRHSLAVQADVRRKVDVDNLVQAVISEFGAIDILVNNAGVYVESPILELNEDDWDNVIDTDLKGAFLCSQAVGKVMVKQKSGNVINIASMNGIRPLINPGGYDVAKAGLIMLTNSLAIELASQNIRVNAIAPGYIRTEMSAFLWDNPELSKGLLEAIAMGRVSEPTEIAKVALFLASEASSYMTGSTILADGGFVWKWPAR